LATSRAGEVILMPGEAAAVLPRLAPGCVDMVMTSPPYWNQREYEGAGIGLERTPGQYLDAILEVTAALWVALSDTGSLWLNLADTYYRKSLAGIPWRTALRMIDEQGWILRNDVIWNKVKGGMDTSRDRLANTHETVFHFVKQPRYHYDLDAIRTQPRQARTVNGAVVSATGVTGVRYRRRIELSTELSDAEKAAALGALDEMLDQVSTGQCADFRMVIRGAGHRVTHSASPGLSGRARELMERGFYFLRYHPMGPKPADVWEIIPEDTRNRSGGHYAAYPLDLCRLPILATCPPGGLVLDPFAGTGTTLLAARMLGRRGAGIDISADYLRHAADRLAASPVGTG
jgi:site-specific DNA-methyltransferase (adenine-specific)